MNAARTWCLAYVLNALWQLPLIYAVASLAARFGRELGPRFLHRVWVVVLGLEWVVPALPRLRFEWLGYLARVLYAAIGHASSDPGNIRVVLGGGATNALALAVAPWLGGLLSLCGAVTLYFAAQTVWRLRRLHIVCLRARPLCLTSEPGSLWQQQCRRFQTLHAQLAMSDHVSGPATTGIWRPLVLIPASFLTMSCSEDQNAAFAHECAHAARHDFAKNLLYEVLSLPISFHPLRHLTLSRIAETREMVCDALAAEAVAGPQRYAKSLLRLAAAVLSAGPPPNHHAIGLCDAHTLERRIMNLTKKQSRLHPAHRLVVGAATLTLAFATCASAAALHMDVQANSVQASTGASTIAIPAGVMAGQVLTRVDPVYPAQAREAHITGAVRLQTLIGSDGTVQHIQVISGPPELQASALEAVRQWIYEPYRLNGKPTAVQTTVTVNYQLAN